MDPVSKPYALSPTFPMLPFCPLVPPLHVESSTRLGGFTALTKFKKTPEAPYSYTTPQGPPGKGEDARFGGGAGSDETGPKYNGKFTANRSFHGLDAL